MLLLHRQAGLAITITVVAGLNARMGLFYGSRGCRSAREQRQGGYERCQYEDQSFAPCSYGIHRFLPPFCFHDVRFTLCFRSTRPSP